MPAAGLRSEIDFAANADMPAASTWPDINAWIVGPMSSKYTISVPFGATFGTVASSSVARVNAMRLPAMSAALDISVFFGPHTTIDSAPFGEQNATVLARSMVIDSDEIAISARPASNAGIRCVAL